MSHASERIYGAAEPGWSGAWTLLLSAPGISSRRRVELERDLKWQGFGQFAPGVFAQPEQSFEPLEEILKSTKTGADVAVFRAATLPFAAPAGMQRILTKAFGLDSLNQRYHDFIEQFSPLTDGCERLDPELSFALRVTLIHAFRRVLLSDPRLPRELLSSDWPGIVPIVWRDRCTVR